MEQQKEKRKGYKRRRQSRQTSPLPIDLTSEILLRLPEKSVVRFRCVSKLWLSITTDPYFIKSFETRTSRPSLLFCFKNNGNLYVFSIPQHTHSLHQDLYKSPSSSQPIESYHIKYPGDQGYGNFYPTESVHGLICFPDSDTSIVWNPSKKQFLTLPRPRKSWKALKVFLGYDPIEGKHKVMCMPLNRSSDVCRVLTLGSAQESWRTVKTNHKHRCVNHTSGRYIEGVIYYVAEIRQTRVWVVMSFDVRSEEFDMIELPSDIQRENLITYRGRLVCVGRRESRWWFLEDAKKHKWSSQNKPPSPFLSGLILRGFTQAGEFVFVPTVFCRSRYVLFYDPVTKSYRRFKFNGIAEGEEFVPGLMLGLHAFPNHIDTQISL